MALNDLGDSKKEEHKEEKEKELGVDKLDADLEDFEDIKDRIAQVSETHVKLDKELSDIHERLDELEFMIKGLFKLLGEGGELVEVEVKDKDDSEETSSWNTKE